jgi:hypothetical protein
MNRSYCDQEPEITAALQSGAWTSDLRAHASTCQICAEVMVVAGCLQHEAELTLTEHTLPNAALIWWKARLLSQNTALARATRPIALVRQFAYLACGLIVVWFVVGSSQGSSWVAGVFHLQMPVQHLWTGFLGELMLIGGVGTLLCVLLGSWYMVRSGSETGAEAAPAAGRSN